MDERVEWERNESESVIIPLGGDVIPLQVTITREPEKHSISLRFAHISRSAVITESGVPNPVSVKMNLQPREAHQFAKALLDAAAWLARRDREKE